MADETARSNGRKGLGGVKRRYGRTGPLGGCQSYQHEGGDEGCWTIKVGTIEAGRWWLWLQRGKLYLTKEGRDKMVEVVEA